MKRLFRKLHKYLFYRVPVTNHLNIVDLNLFKSVKLGPLKVPPRSFDGRPTVLVKSPPFASYKMVHRLFNRMQGVDSVLAVVSARSLRSLEPEFRSSLSGSALETIPEEDPNEVSMVSTPPPEIGCVEELLLGFFLVAAIKISATNPSFLLDSLQYALEQMEQSEGIEAVRNLMMGSGDEIQSRLSEYLVDSSPPVEIAPIDELDEEVVARGRHMMFKLVCVTYTVALAVILFNSFYR